RRGDFADDGVRGAAAVGPVRAHEGSTAGADARVDRDQQFLRQLLVAAAAGGDRAARRRATLSARSEAPPPVAPHPAEDASGVAVADGDGYRALRFDAEHSHFQRRAPARRSAYRRRSAVESGVARGQPHGGEFRAGGWQPAPRIAKTELFPPMMVHMVASGEASGELESMLARSAKNQERELEMTLGGMLAIMEPAMVVLMAVVVGTIVLAILLPIIEMNKLVA